MSRLLKGLVGLSLGIAGGAVAAAEPSFVPVYERNFPDPFVMAAKGGFIAYSTNDGLNLPMAESKDLIHWAPVMDPTRPGKPLPREQTAGSKGRVDQVALALAAVAAARPLTLEHLATSRDKERGQDGAVTACALDREARHAQIGRPLPQPRITTRVRCDREAVEIPTQPVERDSDMQVAMRIDTDCHHAVHRLTSLLKEQQLAGTGLCRAKDAGFYQVTGQPTKRWRKTGPAKGTKRASFSESHSATASKLHSFSRSRGCAL